MPGLPAMGKTNHPKRETTMPETGTTKTADTNTTDAAVTETATTTEQTTEVDYKAEADKWKAMSRKNEDSAKANAEKAKRLDEIEEANKTDAEKFQARAEKAEKALEERNTDDERAKVRDEVAKAKGIPASALRGTSREDFEQHADELIAAGIKPKPGPSSDGQGNVGDVVSTDGDMSADDIVKAATGR